MLAGLAFGSEIKRFGRSRMTRAAIVVLMLLPLVYGAVYLWAFWNPFGNVTKCLWPLSTPTGARSSPASR